MLKTLQYSLINIVMIDFVTLKVDFDMKSIHLTVGDIINRIGRDVIIEGEIW